MHKQFTFGLAIVTITLGCSKSDHSERVAQARVETPSQTAQVSALPVAADSQPDVVTAAFLDAVRTGDHRAAAALLSDLARKSTADSDLKFEPPGSPSASYQITDTKLVDGAAHVNSVWTEPSAGGDPVVYEIVWVLRQQENGWRIAGMVTAPAADEPLVFLNFEDIPDLKRKWQQADEELAAEAEHPLSVQADRGGAVIHR